ncbi:MAG: carboxypeptidase regulatory-like domain-containing protein [Acidobacteria bacterium]|nr:carboxypeptidase regulatory-like domain-containing protein [Acidobacteriota bacterium]
MRGAVAVLGLLFFLLPAPGRASAAVDEPCRLTGAVSDWKEGRLAGASIVVEGPGGKGQKYFAQSDAQGGYRLALPPGRYLVTVTAPGFAPFTEQVDLIEICETSLDARLQVLIKEYVEVKASRGGLSAGPDRNLSSITLSGKDLEALPSDPAALIQRLREMTGIGARPGDIAVYVDGFREIHRLPPKEAIEMIRINSNAFAAEFPEPGRGRIEIITKPGSDDFHGELKFNFNDDALNARDPFALRRAPGQIRNLTGYVGGPILRNRWGFLFYGGHWGQDLNDVVNATILAPATLQPQSFSKTVLTPSRVSNLFLQTNYFAGNRHSLAVWYSRTSDQQKNQGLQSGFDLPEHAYNGDAVDDVFRFSLTSTAEKNVLNELRLELSRRSSHESALSQAPEILVLDAFNGGGNQGSLSRDNRANSLRLFEAVTYAGGGHTFKAGFEANATRLENNDRSDRQGTFIFGADVERDAEGEPVAGPGGRTITITPLENYRRTLLGMPGYRPSQFSIIRGDPLVRFSQWEMAWFAQDDWALSPRLTLSYGLRHEFQTNLDARFNLGPRIALAWIPDSKEQSTIRAGTGIFYNRVDSSITFEALKLDGRRQQQFVIQRPEFFPDVPPVLSGAATSLPTVQIKASDLSAPYFMVSSVSYERQLPLNLFGSIGYTWQRGVHLLRTRNVNVPAPDSLGERPFSDRGAVLQFESSGLSTRRELVFGLRASIRQLTFYGDYTLASTRSDTDDATTSPADSYDLSSEFGRASFDQRHQFSLGASLSLPMNLFISPFMVVRSGQPFNITTGRDDNGDTLFTDRPAFARPDDPGAIVTPFGAFNPNPRPGDVIIPRNLGRGSAEVSVSLYASRSFELFRSGGDPGLGGMGHPGSGEEKRYSLTFSASVQNLFNHTNRTGFNGVLTSPVFAKANRALGARRIEVSLTLSF